MPTWLLCQLCRMALVPFKKRIEFLTALNTTDNFPVLFGTRTPPCFIIGRPRQVDYMSHPPWKSPPLHDILILLRPPEPSFFGLFTTVYSFPWIFSARIVIPLLSPVPARLIQGLPVSCPDVSRRSTGNLRCSPSI